MIAFAEFYKESIYEIKPFLNDLAFRHMKLPVIAVIKQLLEIVPGAFPENFGNKLTEHIQALIYIHDAANSTSSSQSQAAPQHDINLKDGEEIRIATEIVGLMHLVPPHGGKAFIDRLVKSVLDLEKALPSSSLHGHFDFNSRSPYRNSLVKVCSF